MLISRRGQYELQRYKSVNNEVKDTMDKVKLETNRVRRERAEFEQTITRGQQQMQKVSTRSSL